MFQKFSSRRSLISVPVDMMGWDGMGKARGEGKRGRGENKKAEGERREQLKRRENNVTVRVYVYMHTLILDPNPHSGNRCTSQQDRN